MRTRAVVSAASRYSPHSQRPLASLGRISVLPGWDQTLQNGNSNKKSIAYFISHSLFLVLTVILDPFPYNTLPHHCGV